MVASASYLENWYLAFKKYDYLDRDSFASPVQHFWAMSLQGQVYILWPTLLALTGFAARRMGLDLRRAVGGMLLLLFVSSLTYSVITTRLDQPFAYFDTLARLWEISIGGLLALVPAGWTAAASGAAAARLDRPAGHPDLRVAAARVPRVPGVRRTVAHARRRPDHPRRIERQRVRCRPTAVDQAARFARGRVVQHLPLALATVRVLSHADWLCRGWPAGGPGHHWPRRSSLPG